MPAEGSCYRGKRLVDLVVAGTLLVVLSPMLLLVGLAVSATSRGGPLYCARRVGVGGRQFVVLKFRSMRLDSNGPAVTAAGDARITKVGRWLRRTKIDELPQLVNVVLGTMSLVGPRPEDPRYVEQYTTAQREIFRWRPGLTSPASIAYRHEESMLADAPDLAKAYGEIMNTKLAIDLEYFRNSSLRSDLAVLLRTITAL
jgi:lipopolysaccharide/colanic/teichoic acid biosynthesis glycosyltransferase